MKEYESDEFDVNNEYGTALITVKREGADWFALLDGEKFRITESTSSRPFVNVSWEKVETAA